ncbi:MAG: amidohydrolase [Verrucomicrobiota bacterium]
MSIPILDTHQHLIYAGRWPYAWTADIPALAGKSFTYEDYLNEIEGTGIEASIFMETTPDDPHWHEETEFVRQLSESPDSLIRGLIANCRPEEAGDFEDFLDRIDGPALVGLRRFLHAVPDELSESPTFVDNLRRLAPRKLSFDLCVLAHQLPIATRLAKACPEVSFILDHCGIPPIADGGLTSWRPDIAELAHLPNVACKISGVLAYCDPPNATTDAVRPYVEHCIESFGWDRVVWGSDWPVVTTSSSIREWVAISREIVADETLENREKLFHRNARRIYALN